MTKADKLQKGKEVALANEFISLDEKIEENFEELGEKIGLISEELKKKLESELFLEIDKEELKGEKGEDGEDGKDYVLTEKDKKEIAKSIKVPTVEKIVEKVEVIRETPIITNEIKEVAVADTGEEIVNKINELPLDEDKKIDASHIKNLPKNETKFYGRGGISDAPVDGKQYARKDGNWSEVDGGGGAVDSVNGQTGTVVLDADDISDASTTNKFTNSTEKSTWNAKQNALVSGTNIKTINSTSLLGSGNIAIGGVQSVSGTLVNNDDPNNPIVKNIVFHRAGIPVPVREIINIVDPLYIIDDAPNSRSLMGLDPSSLIPSSVVNGDFLWKNAGFAGQMPLYTDGVNIRMGVNPSGGVNDGDTIFNTHGWQKMELKARPFKEVKIPLEPNGLSDPSIVEYDFVDLTGDPYYAVSTQMPFIIPFSFEIPEDFDEEHYDIGNYFHIHFSLSPLYKAINTESTSTGKVMFDIVFASANQTYTCADSVNNFASTTYTIESCSDISNSETGWQHYTTVIDTSNPINPPNGSFMKGTIIKGYITLNSSTTYPDKVIPLSLDFDYQSNELGRYNKITNERA